VIDEGPVVTGHRGLQFWIDRGGTFTDIVARRPDGTLETIKLLSECPERYTDAAVAGMKAILGIADDKPVPFADIEAVKMGTTVATNALLQRRGARTLLLVNEGFADVLRIGDQARPRLFDLAIVLPEPLYECVAEITGRIGADGAVVTQLDEDKAFSILLRAYASGIEACAIALMHGWKYPAHEQRLAEVARAAGFTQVSMSHEVSPSVRIVPRAQTALVDAVLSPILRRYVSSIASALGGTGLYFMQSHGGLTGAEHFRGRDAVLSGPAGGIVGAARTAAMAGFDHVIGFDMGGTSTDVSLYAGGFARVSNATIAGVSLSTPMLAINTVAAGGGSVLHFDGTRLSVGPDSAGANPGPAAYRRGGPLTVTDANICVGKIQPAHFPAMFGPSGDAPLDADAVSAGFASLSKEIARATGQELCPEEVAEGFLRIAVANMANAIRQVSVQKGHDARDFALVSFGGAGGQHACLVAEELGIGTVLIHPLAGVLSAYGMGLADETSLREQTIDRPLDETILPLLRGVFETLLCQARSGLVSPGQDAGTLVHRCLHLRYQGSDAPLAVPFAAVEAMLASFAAAHRARFGYATTGRTVIVESAQIEVIRPGEPVIEAQLDPRSDEGPVALDRITLWSGGKGHAAPVFDRRALRAGDVLAGPALVLDASATTVIEPRWRATIEANGHMILSCADAAPSAAAGKETRADPVLLELFNNLFMNIAEQAGAILRNTASSVNIRERLDFSCAIFDGQGRLVANAPHVPVHLGAMSASVKAVLAARGGTLRPGDVVALNNPFRGGTHLPDITVITPVFADGEGRPVCFAACRGHHADIGGTAPGSTPPDSRTLEEEGVVIDDLLLVENGSFHEAAFRAVLTQARYPARNPDMNVADIQAQIASNEAAAAGLQGAVERYGLATVRAYMCHIMDNAEESIRRVIERLHDGQYDYTMDSGAPLCVSVRVDRAARNATVDFTGTGRQRADNFNAPEAITRAVVLYVFRCLAGTDIPLNEGCLKPLTLIIPPDTFLSPAAGAAVVAGNTEVSQAVCCALFGALGVMASSQATMNNVLFGDATHQYYETIGGGSGAGLGFDGQSAVHTHMTNTRMTDPEILETRYPVRVEAFSIARGSGGAGRWRGGDGIVRRLRFLAPMTAMIVASRRRVAPFGLEGGEAGAPGRQWIDRADGAQEQLSGTDRAAVMPGDVLVVHTPGGGGFGRAA
jgi:5-oxoprolinase (ATP-hydrolysing)